MKELKDFPGYFITEDGRVYSARKKIKGSNGKFEVFLDYKNLTEIKTRLTTNGYCRVNLYLNGKMKDKTVHRLVAETFISNEENLPCVNHIDENKINNNVYNLEWCSYKHNSVHSKCRFIWKIEDMKTGHIMDIINLEDFIKDNNLDARHIYSTLKGKVNQHKNFKIISKTKFK
jgi:hypothetical protein